MAKGRTLWEYLSGKNKPLPVEKQYYNPYGLLIGAHVQLDLLDYRNINFKLKEIRSWKSNNYYFCDLVLNSGNQDVYLRVMPDGGQFNNILLTCYHQCGAQDESHEQIIEATTHPEFVVHEDGIEARFWRLHDLKTPQEAEMTVIKDVNNDGVIDENEAIGYHIRYWDYHRITKDEADQEVTEYLFIQCEEESAWLEIHCGFLVIPEQILIL